LETTSSFGFNEVVVYQRPERASSIEAFIVLLPLQGAVITFQTPRALPWADGSMPLQGA